MKFPVKSIRLWQCFAAVAFVICLAAPEVLSFHAKSTNPCVPRNAASKSFDSTNTGWSKAEFPSKNNRLGGSGLLFVAPTTTKVATKTMLGVTSQASGSVSASDAASANNPPPKELVGKAVFIVPHNANDITSKFGSYSPYGSPSILEAAEQLQRKTLWFSDGAVEADIVVMPEDGDDNDLTAIRQQIFDANAVIAFNLERDSDLSFVNDVFDKRKAASGEQKELCQFALDCKGSKSNLPPLCGPYDPESPSLSSRLFPWSNGASGKRMEEQMMGLFDRWTSDDFTYALLLFFNQYAAPIDWVKHSIDATWEKGPVRNAQEFYKMISECGDCIAKCVADENCKECLDALTAVDTSDQVASYRTIVSYESDLLRDFSFCILQKNNIFGCDAKIPQLPKVTPMSTFRGKPLTKEVARQILIGHLNEEEALDSSLRTDISWKVSAGANVAYDQFPSQNQIFYNSADGRSMWYDPVFRVETIDGRNVWAKRHYRVRDGKVPGTFRFSVLDNGVTSDEFWTLVDVADDLSYIIFHYAGAAGAVGQRYLGGLLCTADGSLPSEAEREAKIYPKLRSAGIDPWELFIVDNSEDSAGMIDAGPPPLDFFRKDVLKKKEEKKKLS